MNSPSNAPEAALDARVIAPAAAPASRPFYWSVRRELWENRWIYLAPLAAAGVAMFGFLLSLTSLPRRMRGLAALDAATQNAEIQKPFDIAMGLILVIALLAAIFYCLDALHGERRDRSILFWKSLPVSDLTTVMSKAVVPVFIVLCAWAITVVTEFFMLLLGSAVLAGSGVGATALWTKVSLFQLSLILLYHLVTVHILWHAPLYSWLLLVSAWARRAALLWAALPPLAIMAVEKIVFNSSHFANLLLYRLTGGLEAVGPMTSMLPTDPTQLTPGRLLVSPGLWIGLFIAAAFLAAVVRLRRYRGPI
jgi:ABC-2 type transport system permease protein